jgi:lysophospholipase L1-like esterase
MAEARTFWNRLNILGLLFFIGISGLVYAGFFYPDPTIFAIHWSPKLVSWGIRIFFPSLIIALMLLYRAVYLGKIRLQSLFFLAFLGCFGLLLAYPLADYLYAKSGANRLQTFHAYLQLNPPNIEVKDSTAFTLFYLGGSTTEFKDQAGRDWPTLVEKKLHENARFQAIRCYNCGKQWYTTQHILINYIENLRKFKPDILLVMENINDLLHNADFSRFSSGPFREDYGTFLGPLARLMKYGSLSEFVLEMSRSLWYRAEPEYIETNHFPGIVSYERNLRTLITLAKSDGTRVILMTQPNIYKDEMTREELAALFMLNKEAIGNGKRWTYKTARTGIRAYNDKIREIAASEGLDLIDLEKMVPQTLEYFYDDVHYRSKTYDLIATDLAAALQPILAEFDRFEKTRP